MKLELILPEDRLNAMSAAEWLALSEADILREEVGHLTTYLYRAAFGEDWKDAAPECRCGEPMYAARTPYHNSGTTRISFACRHAVPYTDTGHQWAVTAWPEHYLDTDGGQCCGGLRESMEVQGCATSCSSTATVARQPGSTSGRSQSGWHLPLSRSSKNWVDRSRRSSGKCMRTPTPYTCGMGVTTPRRCTWCGNVLQPGDRYRMFWKNVDEFIEDIAREHPRCATGLRIVKDETGAQPHGVTP